MKHISVSGMKKFMQSPHSWYRTYVQGIKDDKSQKMVEGSAVHAGLETFGNAILEHGIGTVYANKVKYVGEAQDAGRAVIAESFADVTVWTHKQSRIEQKVADIIAWTIDEISFDFIGGVEVDTQVMLPIPDVQHPLRGIMDRIDRLENGDVVVYDYKLTTKEKDAKNTPAYILQAWAYYFLCEEVTGVKPTKMVFIEIANCLTERGFRVTTTEYDYTQKMEGNAFLSLFQVAEREMMNYEKRKKAWQVLPNVEDVLSGQKQWQQYVTSVYDRYSTEA